MCKTDLITQVVTVAGAMSLCMTAVFCSAAMATEASRVALALPFENGVGYESSHDVLHTDFMVDDHSYANWLYVSLGVLSDSGEPTSRDFLQRNFWEVVPTEIYRTHAIAERDQPDEFGPVVVSYRF